MQYIKKILLAFLVAVLLLAVEINSVDAAEVYTWVDAKGVRHYSDRPVFSAKKQKIRVSSPAKKASDESEQPLLSDSDQAKQDANCNVARSNVANLLKGGRITEKDEEGKTIVLSTEEMNKKLSVNQDYIKRNCKNALASESS